MKKSDKIAILKYKIGDLIFQHKKEISNLEEKLKEKNSVRDADNQFVRKDVYEMLFDKCEKLQKDNKILEKNVLDARFTPKATSNTIFKLEEKVSDLLLDNNYLRKRIQSVYAEHYHSAPRYQFSEIPNNEEGSEFINLLRKYLNKDRYTISRRGQHLKEGEDWRQHQYGQSIDKSSHIRVYIDQKKEKK